MTKRKRDHKLEKALDGFATLRAEVIDGLANIRKHAEEMAGKTAMIQDKTGPILETVRCLLVRLGVEDRRPAPTGLPDDLDIGQGDGCEGDKCKI